jgi:dipeptidyl aminopeptidase/acylaminoacyl peptidase
MTLATDTTKLTPKKVAWFVLDLALVLLLPLVVTSIIGVYQLSHPPKIISTRTPKDANLTYKDVTLKSTDGISVAAWDVDATAPSDTAILVLHGYGDDKGDILSRVAFLAPQYRLLLIDFRSFGKSGGGYTTIGQKEIADAQAGIDYLRGQGVKRIGIYGFSMGGAVALRAAARNQDVAVVVTEEAYADIRTMVEQPYRYLGPLRWPLVNVIVAVTDLVLHADAKKDTPTAAASTLHVPVLVIHARGDTDVPIAEAEALKTALAGDNSASFWFSDGVVEGQSPIDFSTQVKNFFDGALGATH